MDLRLAERLHAVTHVFDPPLGQGDGPTFAVKDLIDVAGVATGGGGRVPLAHPTRHAFAVEALLAAGYRCVAKTHTVELAYGGWGTNRAVGAPWNPWDADVHRAPGGSSSGSAVAVAAGLCDLALGTDTGGSVRIPAHACGVVGLKPGRGAVPLLGVHDLAPSLDTLGVLARDVPKAARALGILAVDRPFDVEVVLRKPVSGWRLAALRPADLPDLAPGVARLYAEALEKLSVSGVIVQEVTPPRPMTAYFGPNGALMAAEGWRVRGAHISRNADVMDPWIVSRFRQGEHVTDAQLAAALAQRAADQAEFYTWINDFDALVCPTAPIVAPPIDTVDETTSPLSSLTRAANWLDLPAASVPCGLADALPAGFQIIGRPKDEISVIALAAAFERVSGWNGRGPDLRSFT